MVKPIGWFESRSWWPLALSAAVLVVAVAFDPRGAYPSVALTLVAQLVFLTLSSAAVVALVGRAFLAEGSVSLLLLACGAVFLGLGGVIATAAAPGAVNVVITIHNLCAWCSAACHFVGILLAQRWRIDRARSAALGGAILAALTLIGVCVAAARGGWLPTFFVQGEGGTLTRQMVLGSAVLMFAVSGIALLRLVHRDVADYRRWYGLGMLALSLGLAGVLMQRVQAGVVGWVGVITQLLGGAYLLAAAWSATKGSPARVALSALPSLSSSPGSAPMRYVLAVAFVLAAAAVRLALFPQLGTASPYILFFPAVVLSALYCGPGPAAVAALLAVVLGELLWMEPVGRLSLLDGRNALLATLFLVNSAVIVAVSESLRKAQRRSVIAEFEAAAAREREALAAQVEAGRARLDDALRAARMVAWEYDTRTDRITASSNLASVYGLARGTTLEHERDGMRHVHPDDAERHRATVQRAIEGGGAYTSLFRFVRPIDGRTIWIEERARARPGDDGRTARLVGTSSDVTERETTARRLQDSELRYRALFEAMDEGFCVVQILFDAQGAPRDYRFVEVNPAFEIHTGLEGALGRTALELVPELEPFWIETYGRVALTGEPSRFIDHAQALQARWFDVYAFRVGQPGDARVTVLFNDVSERMRVSAEREVLLQRMREQDARKDEFLATLAHELRNPLAPLRSGLRLLDTPRGDNPGAWRNARSMMERQVDLLVRLIDDLLDIARINRGKIVLRRCPVALIDVVHRAAEISHPLIDAGNHALSIDLPREPVMLDADEIRLAQVFSNLLNNAAKYSEPGGRIALAASVVDRGAEAGRGGRVIEVRVRDEGIGMSPQMVTRVFDLYAQADPSLGKAQGGLGIGLTLARSLVELHGGSLAARSEGLGHGSEFVVTLPLMPALSDESPRLAPAPKASANAVTVAAPQAAPHGASPSGGDATRALATQPASTGAAANVGAATNASVTKGAHVRETQPGAAGDASGTARRILIADDNVDAADTLAALLEIHGHEVRTVYDGRSAIDQCEAWRPDVVLLDVGMPGMSGLEACRAMRTHDWGQRAHIVAVTGWGDEQAQRRCRDAGFDDWMIKPVDDAALQHVLTTRPTR